MKCAYCPQQLRTAESKARGYGPICGQKLGLIPKPTPRRARALTPVTPVMTPTVHPGQTAIPIQPQLPTEPQ
ncbi:DUF6011 domain-containing protein [Streptomyces sp. NPDC096142]|uniref:DUF6011 domain-containing protein n=1 Tax=Streptomyces sp. NPDC096142 TaxID=3366077 RepID=UPI003818267D